MEDEALKYLAQELKKAEQNLLESLGDGVAQDYPPIPRNVRTYPRSFVRTRFNLRPCEKIGEI